MTVISPSSSWCCALWSYCNGNSLSPLFTKFEMEMRDTFLEEEDSCLTRSQLCVRNLAVYTSCFFAGLSKNSWQMMLTSPDLSWAQEKKERREGFTQKYEITIFCQNNNAQSVSKKGKLPWPVHSPNITTKEDERKCYNNATIFALQKACSEERSLPMKNTGDALQLCSFGRCRINVAATSHFFLALLTWIMTGVLVMDVWLCE